VIESLKANQIFVFGSNLEGKHYGGAAKQAHEQFGAEMGVGVGLTGDCYAIPTMTGLDEIKRYVHQFKRVAELLPSYEFLVTRIGCGIAGHTDREIAPLFENSPPNVVLPEEWK
jgi:hypothetical protein